MSKGKHGSECLFYRTLNIIIRTPNDGAIVCVLHADTAIYTRILGTANTIRVRQGHHTIKILCIIGLEVIPPPQRAIT